MQTDSLIVPQTLIKPRSFSGLMSLYESNYLRLHQLIPTLDSARGVDCSLTGGDLPLHADIIERTRYTCTLQLTYLFAEDPGKSDPVASHVGATREAGLWLADPDLRLRVYFDGRLAEVMSLTSSHRHAILRHIAACHREELDLRWQRNMMLNKWLEYCIEAGHCLHPVDDDAT